MKSILIVFLLTISFVSVKGQTENDLKKYFEGSKVRVKIDMPASAVGIDVYVQRNPQIKIKKIKVQLHGDGTGIHNGDWEQITKIKVKGKHIELHLGGGGYRGTTVVNAYVSPEPTSSLEDKLEKKLKKETDPERRREIIKDLKSEQRSRESRDNDNRKRAQANAETENKKIARDRLDYGSRFNIRFDRKITAQDLSPQVIVDALSAYIDF